jgi:hypothetical protein
VTLHLVGKKGNRIPPVTNQSQQGGSSLCVDVNRPMHIEEEFELTSDISPVKRPCDLESFSIRAKLPMRSWSFIQAQHFRVVLDSRANRKLLRNRSPRRAAKVQIKSDDGAAHLDVEMRASSAQANLPHASDRTSILRNQISANSNSIAIFPRLKGRNCPAFTGSGCSIFEAAFTALPLTI